MNMRSFYQSNNVRRTNSDSNLGRSLETNPSSRNNETLVPNGAGEPNAPNPLRQISLENLTQRANLFIGNVYRGRSARDAPSLSNNAITTTMNTLRRNLAMRLLSAVSESQQEQNNDGGVS